MSLADPVKGFVCQKYPGGDVTQWFGENPTLYANTCVLINNASVCLKGHNGIDIVRPWGEPIYCVDAGKVVENRSGGDANSTKGYGQDVRVLSDSGYEYIYAHLSSNNVELGQRVEVGDLIGKMGNTGFVVSGATPFWKYNPYAGTHLHLGRRPVIKTTDPTQPHNVSYATGDIGNIPNYPGDYLGSVYIGPEDFEISAQVPPTQPTIDMTIQSLTNYANQLDSQNKASQAIIVRAIIGVIKAFRG